MILPTLSSDGFVQLLHIGPSDGQSHAGDTVLFGKGAIHLFERIKYGFPMPCRDSDPLILQFKPKDVFRVKYSVESADWARSGTKLYGNTGSQYGSSVAVDGSDNPIISDSTLRAMGRTIAGGSDVF